ncbi:MAG: FHA domain-containing protein [Lachnospiraceae bacterium]|nr:FHA domain-containing protein [Lachnospiraceae bacterium]
MSYKTLIIIDNTSELTTLNREIIKETIKCFIRDNDREDKVAIAVTGEKAEYLTDYEDSLNTQLKAVDNIEFKDVNASGADVIMEVILSWKESDVAYRDILYVSCTDVSLGSNYSKEELFFEISDKQYPIYSLACAQNENTAFIKGIGSLSRISGGTSVSTEDAKSDAEVEKQLSEMLHKAINEKRKYEQEELEKEKEEEEINEAAEDEEEEAYEAAKEEDTETYEVDEEVYSEEANEQPDEETAVIYDMSEELNNTGEVNMIILPVIVIAFVMIVFAVSIYLSRKKKERDEENSFNEIKGKIKSEKKREPFESVFETETVVLSQKDNDDDSDTGTRLLFQTKEGIDITLEDRADPTKYFRACVRDAICIGRSDKLCDIPITYDDSVSSRHCEIYQRDSVLYCRDLGSSNGTMINQQKVYQEVKIESGDILRIGRLSFFVQVVGDNYGR